MASTVWKGYVSFGLVSIPIRIFAAARDERVTFHQIHRECQTRVRQQLFCPVCDRVVERSEIVRGYEAEKDRYVTLAEKDLKSLAPASSETMEIFGFVHLKEIDPVYFDASYYAVAEEAGKKAYELLLQSMEKLEFVALVKISMHQREHLAVIRPYHHGLTLHTMFFANEVRELAEYGRKEDVELKPQEAALAERLIQSLVIPFEPEKYKDTYQQALLKMIESNRAHAKVDQPATRRLAPVIDLAEALRKSLAGVDSTDKGHHAAENSKRSAKERRAS